MLYVLLYSTVVICALCANLPESELSALYDLYNSTNGDHWTWLTEAEQAGVPWDFAGNPNPCTDNWQGVNCTLNALSNEYHVQYLELPEHNLAGPLPETIQALTNLTRLGLRFNKLTGTIPDVIGNLANLQFLLVNGNQLIGSIPSSLGSLTSLLHLELYTNHLNESIPLELCNLHQLQYVNLKVNRLTGTLPECIGELSQLTYLNVHTNRLHGTLPASIGDLTLLKVMDLGANLFSGYLPLSVQHMYGLQQLYIDVNKFSGPIPPEWGNLPAIEAFYIDINALTGTIPTALANMTTVLDLYIDYNQLTGTIPEILSELTSLQYLFVNDNYLVGTLPINLGNLTHLQYLEVHNNYLHGTVPTEYRKLSSLMVLLVQNNFFSGPITGIFSPSTQKSLSTIQINNNQITGSIPAAVFELPQLNTFVAVSNCFHGALPPTVCNGLSMTSLVLDGLSSAPACRDRLLPGLSASYIVADVVDGTIPACLLKLGNLSTLHLSGNGFTGSLPDVGTQLGPSLSDLSLSHNLLTGTIPASIQTRKWVNLDLSYNRLTGTLKHNFGSVTRNSTKMLGANSKLSAEQVERIVGFEISGLVSNYYFNVLDELDALNQTRIPAVSLENNRLSGRIPSFMQLVTDISILGSNVFYCGVDRQELPPHDDNSNNYECASIAFDIPYYVWLSLSLAVVVVAVVLYYQKLGREAVTALQQWWAVFNDTTVKNKRYINRVNKYVDLLCSTAVWSTVYILTLLLPFYCIASYFYGTITHQYAWVASAAFLAGTTTLALEFPLLVCFLVAVGLFFTLKLASSTSGGSDRTTIADAVSTRSLLSMLEWRVLAITLLYITINIIIVVGVNAGFVYVAIYENSALLLLAQILLTMFKLFWNSVCTMLILEHIVHLFNRHAPMADAISHTANQFASLRIFVALLNNIVIPCLVVAVVSPNCFYNVFDAAPAVTSSYTYELCLINNNDHCVVYLPVVSATEYNPPFRYSFQCSSSMITYYAPAFVILSVVITFIIPAAKIIGVLLHAHVGKDTRVYRLLELSLPAILLPLQDPATIDTDHPVYYDPNRELVRLITYLGILMTFGAVFPPLAVALALTVLASAYFSRVTVGRFLHTALEKQWPQYVEVIERECAQVGSSAVLHNSMWMLLSVSCCFYTLFLFDTLGDAVGFYDALWIIIIVPLLPAFFYLAVVLYAKFWAKSDIIAHEADDGRGVQVEMSISVDYRNSSIANPTLNVLWRTDAK